MTAHAPAAGQVVEINFRPEPEPDPDDHQWRKYNDGDPVPDGWYVIDHGHGHKSLHYDYPYEETTPGQIEALAEQVRALSRRLRAVERAQTGAR